MKKRSDNIYQTGYRDRDFDAPPPAKQGKQVVDAWTAARAQRRRHSVLFGITVAGFVTLLAIVMLQQYLLTTKISSEEKLTESAAIEKIEASSLGALDFETSPQAELVLNDLSEMRIMDIPQDQTIPFNAQWMKQAAYYIIQAEQAYKEDELSAALEHYDKALKIYPHLEGIHRYRGLIYLQMQDYPAAAKAFEKSTGSEEMSHGVLNNLGVSHLALKEYGKAEEFFLRALRVEPDYALAYLNMATLHVRAGNQAKAAQYFNEYRERRPDDIKAGQAYAGVLMDLHQWGPAAKLLNEIRQQAPELAPVYFRLAQALSHVEKSVEAIQALRRGSVLVDPRQALAWLSRVEFDSLRNETQFQSLIAELSTPEEEEQTP